MKWTCIKCDAPISQHKEYCPACEEKRYRKIGGFLFIPLFNLFYLGVVYFISAAGNIIIINESYTMMISTHKLYFLMALVANSVLFFMIIYVISIFLRKKKSLPKLFIFLIISTVAIPCLDQMSAVNIFDGYKIGFEQIMPIIRALVFAIIWSLYFLKSVRVKKTFIYS